MVEDENKAGLSSKEWWKRYGLGAGAGTVLALYGLVALLIGQTFLPGLEGEGWTIGGKSGQALAGAYLGGGVYLALRLYVDKRVESKSARTFLYACQCLLLVGLIGLLVYVLLHVGEVV